MLNKKFKVGVLGATGMVGQRFITRLKNHPWFEVVLVAASPRSAGKTYEEAVAGKWMLAEEIPESVKRMIVKDVASVEEISAEVDFVFCALDMDKAEIIALENAYAQHETPVISNNSAHRDTPDVPMILPEINPHHAEIILAQRKRLGTKRGFIAVKTNCSLQSYMLPLYALMDFNPSKLIITTCQAISGKGKNFKTWPEILDNLVPYIGGEEEKSETEPLKILGTVGNEGIINATAPLISAQCLRVAVEDGHSAAVRILFDHPPVSVEEIIEKWQSYRGRPQELNLPSAPQQVMKYFTEEDRPQPKLDRNYENGMGITIGQLRKDAIFNYKFFALSHNTIRGAAGGAILMAELLVADGYLVNK